MHRRHFAINGLVSFGLILSLDGIAMAAQTTAILDAPYWEIGDGLQTTIMMNNTRLKSITATLHVYDDKGASLSETPVTIDPMSTKSLSVGDVLSTRPRNGNGYLELQYSGTPVDIAAQAIIQDQTQGVHWNHVFESNKRYLSAHYEGVFTGGGDLAGATLVLTNVSGQTVLVGFTITENGKRRGETFQLASHNQRVVALAPYLAGAEGEGRRVIGVSISHSGAPGDLIAQGLASLGGQGSYNVHLFDIARLQSASLLSPALLLPWAHSSFLAVRNTSAAGSLVSLIAHYNKPGGEKAQKIVLQKVNLEANGAVVVDLRNSLSRLPGGATDVDLELATSDNQGKPITGHTVADLILLADQGNQVIQMSLKDPLGDAFAGFSQPWDITGTNQTVIALTNPSTTNPVGVMLSLHYARGQYSYPSMMLAPGETRQLSVNDIRDKHLPGTLGQKLPATASSGASLISVAGPHDLLIAESIVADPTQQIALTSSCSSCGASASSYTVDPNGMVTGVIGDQLTLTPVCHLDDGTQYQVLNMNALTWSPGDSSVVNVTNDGTYAYLNFVGGGSTTVDTTSTDCTWQYDFTSGQCDCQEVQLPVQTPIQAQTQVPTSLSIVAGSSSTSGESSAGCPGGMCGVTRTLQYQVLDQNGAAINKVMSVWDQIFNVNGQNGCQLSDTYITTCSPSDTGPCGVNTNSSGVFNDSLSICSTHCFNGSACSNDGCSTTANQVWIISGHAVTTDPKTLVYSCNNITINGQ